MRHVSRYARVKEYKKFKRQFPLLADDFYQKYILDRVPCKSLNTSLKAEINADARATRNIDRSPLLTAESGVSDVKDINQLSDEVIKVLEVQERETLWQNLIGIEYIWRIWLDAERSIFDGMASRNRLIPTLRVQIRDAPP